MTIGADLSNFDFDSIMSAQGLKAAADKVQEISSESFEAVNEGLMDTTKKPEMAEELKKTFKSMKSMLKTVVKVAKSKEEQEATKVAKEQKATPEDFLRKFPELNRDVLDHLRDSGALKDKSGSELKREFLEKYYPKDAYLADKALQYLSQFSDDPEIKKSVIDAQKQLRTDPMDRRNIAVGEAISTAIDGYEKKVDTSVRKGMRDLAYEIMGKSKTPEGNKIDRLSGFYNVARSLLRENYSFKEMFTMNKFMSTRMRSDLVDSGIMNQDTRAKLAEDIEIFRTMQAVLGLMRFEEKSLPRLQNEIDSVAAA